MGFSIFRLGGRLKSLSFPEPETTTEYFSTLDSSHVYVLFLVGLPRVVRVRLPGSDCNLSVGQNGHANLRGPQYRTQRAMLHHGSLVAGRHFLQSESPLNRRRAPRLPRSDSLPGVHEPCRLEYGFLTHSLRHVFSLNYHLPRQTLECMSTVWILFLMSAWRHCVHLICTLANSS